MLVAKEERRAQRRLATQATMAATAAAMSLGGVVEPRSEDGASLQLIPSQRRRRP